MADGPLYCTEKSTLCAVPVSGLSRNSRKMPKCVFMRRKKSIFYTGRVKGKEDFVGLYLIGKGATWIFELLFGPTNLNVVFGLFGTLG